MKSHIFINVVPKGKMVVISRFRRLATSTGCFVPIGQEAGRA